MPGGESQADPSGAGEVDFIALMNSAQSAHGAGNYDESSRQYALATHHAPDAAEYLRALRGYASSTERRGPEYAAEAGGLARKVYNEHKQLAAANPDSVEIRRHWAESGRVVGRMTLRRALDKEAAMGAIPWYEYGIAHYYFLEANEILQGLHRETGVYDQHLKNLNPYLSYAWSLLVHPEKARPSAFAAARMALSAEEPSNPTSAQRGFKYRGIAVGAACVRAATSLTVSALITPRVGEAVPVPTRRRGLAVALLRKVPFAV